MLTSIKDFATNSLNQHSSMVLSSLVASHGSRNLLDSIGSNPHLIGATWIASSAIFTTYSTTTFLKYQPQQQQGSFSPQQSTDLSSQKTSSISRASLLTLYRFGGSFLLGLLLHPNLQIIERLQETLKAVPTFALPAFFLFAANFSNSISLDRVGIR